MPRPRIQLILIFFLLFSGCSSEEQGTSDYLVRVNDYQISAEEMNEMIRFESHLDSDLYVRPDRKTEFVREVIQRQLLIQEAKRRNLDQREQFRQTIQRHWEATLIRDLLAEKGGELRKSTVVTEEEVENYYKDNKEFLPDLPYDELKEEVVKRIEDEKVENRLQAWIDKLRTAARIEIKDPVLADKVAEEVRGG